MHGDLSHHLARALEAERLREADQRASLRAVQATDDRAATHERTRALVLASLLWSRRSDPANHRRWAEE